MTFQKILVANRGEIALRIMRTIREMGILSVAVYSEADRKSPHVFYADQSVCIGPSPAKESYLDADRIIQAALDLGVDAIHPGYGFLSENADFAQKVEAAGMTFIGPSVHSIQTMGDKIKAKQAVAQYGIPMVPGTNHPIVDTEEASTVANQIGYPVLIKASAGGGGKGMRVVEQADQLASQMNRATSEALSAFGNGSVFIEKYIGSPKHIEIQVLADNHDNYLYLFERECSIQRRHQKVIEEAPSPVVSPEMRKEMGEAAIKVAKACNYVGAGTVEFIVDEHLDFFFLEMNTRLQVEHPVTEMITGIDLVEAQIKVAQGEILNINQEELRIHGHTLEVRVYAEDPANGFLPDIGTLMTYKRPQGPGIRVDDGFEEGMSIPIFYDPMIAKLIVHAADRPAAIQKMKRAIEEYNISGIATTLEFARFVLEHEEFINGNFDTKFVENHFSPSSLIRPLSAEEKEVLAILAVSLQQVKPSAKSNAPNQSEQSKWKSRRFNA
ncbi:acetyl-CoA carboxylase biotin carboxylase subunit [Echinicola pacifica]|uniref:Acetyl-CoA carboxylase biotin carboxylase subunit n=1 Tax=Echinicola pacifica TaxID=346377 RepID=A0A918Q114_9BACT|nr:acetyl-CoA carboxylase biotin carboxylase subunit [Echinicola pacifica]GGZ30295.1 acetyl-CoA carboxylase biotin carboxylase subunit [Echinicola pacifica]